MITLTTVVIEAVLGGTAITLAPAQKCHVALGLMMGAFHSRQGI